MTGSCGSRFDLSHRHNPIARPFGNQSDGYSGPEGTAAEVIESSGFGRATNYELRTTMFRSSRIVPKRRAGAHQFFDN
jgi:hypothetical protein